MRRRKRHCPFKPGDRIRATAMFGHHDYERGPIYQVIEIDASDSTLRARDDRGEVHGWIRWKDCKPADEIGWEWLKGQLPAETLELLSAFDGLESLRLRQELRIELVKQVPSLKKRILDAGVALESDTPNPNPAH